MLSEPTYSMKLREEGGQGEDAQCLRKGLGEVRSEQGGSDREGEGQTQRWVLHQQSGPAPSWLKRVLNVQFIRLLSRGKVSVMIRQHPSLQMYRRASDFFLHTEV